MEKIETRCAISGGGPAGIMLGYLLARAGIDVVVLEKWPDFFRDFRGDTIHPSTMEVLKELGLLEKFVLLPHNKTRQMVGRLADRDVVMADFGTLKVAAPYIAFIPQWDFLNFMTREASVYPNFHIMMASEVSELVEENGKIVGLKAKNEKGEVEIRAELVVGADGRHSTVREKAKLTVINTDASIDVLWFRIPRVEDGNDQSYNIMQDGKMLVMLNRADYWQCADVIKKGKFEDIKAAGFAAFKASIGALDPRLAQGVQSLSDWEDVKFLGVTVDHLETWHQPGLLCIGDAAHAMSPAGGVGINLAIQDAVGAANILIPAFRAGIPADDDNARIQSRREFPARMTQRMQINLHKRGIIPFVSNPAHRTKLPFIVWLVSKLPFLGRIPARIVGMGFRPERVEVKW